MASIDIEDEVEVMMPFFKQYKANELLEGKKHALHNLLQKQPMSMGAVQTVCGIMLFGLGVVLAIASPHYTLGVLLRVPALTGLVFSFSGLLSFLLYRFPELLPVSYSVNIGSMVVAVVGVILLGVDILKLRNETQQLPDLEGTKRVLGLVLSVTLLEIVITAVLLYWLHMERKKTRSAVKARE